MISFTSFVDELVKIANAQSSFIGELLKKHPKKLIAATLATGAGGYHVGKQGVDDYRLGRMIRKQQSAPQE